MTTYQITLLILDSYFAGIFISCYFVSRSLKIYFLFLTFMWYIMSSFDSFDLYCASLTFLYMSPLAMEMPQ